MKKKFIRSFKKKRDIAAKKSKFLLRHPMILPATTFVFLFFAGLALFVTLGASTQGASDARIVNIYIDGEQQTVTTRSKNVGDLLNKLDIPYTEEDIVEPAVDTLILEDDTQVNIYKARPVELVEGDRVKTILTAQRAPRLVAEEAEIKLHPEDKVELVKSEASVLEAGISETLVIDRSVDVQLNIYGVLTEIRTTSDTVNDLLVEQGISPGENETVQPKIDSSIKSGLLVSVNRPGIKTLAVNEDIPYESETKNDGSIKAGSVKIETAGVNGKKAIIYEIKENKGKEISRKEIQKVVIKKPIKEVRLVGTKIEAPTLSSTTTIGGDKASIMAAAGIPESDYAFVDYIVNKESRWRPGAANSYSGAYGLCQSLPASKMASAGADYRTNPVTQLKWCSGYASGRYGSWSGAYNAWLAQGWW